MNGLRADVAKCLSYPHGSDEGNAGVGLNVDARAAVGGDKRNGRFASSIDICIWYMSSKYVEG